MSVVDSATWAGQIANAAWEKAEQLSVDASKRIDVAVAFTQPAPSVNAPSDVAVPTLPGSITLPSLDQPTATALYESMRSDLMNQFEGIFSSFLSDNFPDDSFVGDAQDWITRALTTGGAGINVAVEQQVWGRARDKAIAEAQRQREGLEADWTNRRFPLPPGAFRYGLLQIDRTAQEQIGEAGRTAAIESFSREVENARLAVERAVSLRQLALSSAGEYIRVLALGPQTAAQVSSSIIDSQSRFSQALTDYYRAQVSAAEIPLRVQTTNAELKARTNEQNLRAALETLQQRVNAVMANAQQAATQAAAAFNAIHTSFGVQGNTSVNTNIEG